MAKVWFIRHAESEGDAGRATMDYAEVELTEQGHRQAKTIAQFFPREPSLIVTSSYTRSKQTALATLQRFPGVPQQEWRVHEFTYLSLSQQFSTKQERQSLVDAFWERNDPKYVDGEGAESFYEFLTRVNNVFEALNTFDDEEFIAIFSHGQFIRAILWMLQYSSLPTDMKQFRHFLSRVPFRNGWILEITSWKDSVRWCVKQLPSRSFLLTSAYKLLDGADNLILV